MKAILWAYLLNARKHTIIIGFNLIVSALMYCFLLRMINETTLFVVIGLSVVTNVEFYRSLNDDLFKKSIELIYAVPNGPSIHRKIIAIKSVAYSFLYLLIIYIDRRISFGISIIPVSMMVYYGTIVLTDLIGLRICLRLGQVGKMLLFVVQTALAIVYGVFLYYNWKEYAFFLNVITISLLAIVLYYMTRKNKAKEKIIIRSIKS